MTSRQPLVENLRHIRQLVDDCLVALNAEKPVGKASVPRTSRVTNSHASPDVNVLAIVNKIKDCDEADNIDDAVLAKSSVANRILLPLYICYKYFPARRLSTGEISKITSELSVRIKQPNVARTITDSLQKYLEGDSTRKKGQATNYKLNRKGATYFESIINATAPRKSL